MFGRYHFDGRLAIGAGLRVSVHDLENGFSLNLGGLVLEARYGSQVNGERLAGGERFFPFIGARVGAGMATIEPPDEEGDVVTRGWELGPVAGAQYWFSSHFGLDVAASIPFDRLSSTSGHSFVLQPAIVIGW